MTYPVLYKRTARGQVQTWQIETNGHRFRTVVGRTNETSATQQADKEAESRHRKKLESGYSVDRASIDVGGFFRPMLAKSYDDYKDEIDFPVWSQPKLDGVRCVASKDGLFSRNGKPIASVPHIWEAIRHLFESQPQLVLDGELYSDALKHDFNQLISLAKKAKLTANDLAASMTLEYWVYDLYDGSRPNLTYSERLRLRDYLTELIPKPYVRVKTDICTWERAVDYLYDRYLESGYEGQMIRTDVPYANKRTKTLLKRKPMIDSEFEIVDIEPGRGGAAHRAARAVLKTEVGDRFEVGIIGSHEYASDLLKHRQSVIGKMATVVYQNMTPGEHPVPRFGKLKTLRDYE
jgi:DNA ligase-1